MPFERKKDGNVIAQRGTKQPTPVEFQESKKKEIADQIRQRAEFEKGRQVVAATSVPGEPGQPKAAVKK